MASFHTVGLTTCPLTRQAAERIAALIDTGIRFVDAGQLLAVGDLDAVIELTLTDFDAARKRLTAACQAAIPLVIVPGGLESCSPADGDRIGREVAFLASASRGPVTVVVPSCVPQTIAQSLKNWISSDVSVVEIPARIGDDDCAATVAAALQAVRANR